jgi:biotin transport system substrate-specific component
MGSTACFRRAFDAPCFDTAAVCRYDARMRQFSVPCLDAARPVDSRLSGALLVALGSLAIVVLAQVSIPIGPVPVTGQTLGVLAVGAALGPRRGPYSILVYLAYGALGLPVFAGGTGGLVVFAGPTAGYLAGFVAAAWLVGTCFERPALRRPVPAALVLLAATVVLYAFGVAWLSRFVGWDRVLVAGVYPFVVGDLLKIAIVAMGARTLSRL